MNDTNHVIYLSARRPLPAPRVIRQKPNWGPAIAWLIVLLTAIGVSWWGVIAIVIWLHHIAELALQ